MSLKRSTKILNILIIVGSGIISGIFVLSIGIDTASITLSREITGTLLQVDGILLGFLGIIVATLITRSKRVHKRMLKYETNAAGFCVAAIFFGIITLLAPASDLLIPAMGLTLVAQVMSTFVATLFLLEGLNLAQDLQ